MSPVATTALHPYDKDGMSLSYDDDSSPVIAVHGEIADSSAGFAFRAVEVHCCQSTGIPVLYHRGNRIGNAFSFSQILEDAVRI